MEGGRMTQTDRNSATNDHAHLVLDGVGKSLQRSDSSSHEVLRDITFEVRPREFVALVGPSGVGKTTLLRLASGLLAPDVGAVHHGGETPRGVPPWLSIVFQNYAKSLFPWMTNADNVMLALGAHPRRTQREKAREALTRVGLEDVITRYPWELSGGMQQRVAIARAIAVDLSLLLLDEPFASVDALTRADLEDTVLELWRDLGFSALLVTHDIAEAVYMADRIIVLGQRPGTIVATIDVDLPRPRDHVQTTRLPAYGELYGTVLGHVQRRETSPGRNDQPDLVSESSRV
jgi:NitT/TauT family transport system ATP-binding protein